MGKSRNYKKLFCSIFAVIILSCVCVSCQSKIKTFDESYHYTKKSGYYVLPSCADGWIEKNALKTTVENDVFFIFSNDNTIADRFINSQRTLLCYLRERGVNSEVLKVYGTDYDFSFSESGAAYITLNDMNSWQQVLATLQAMWGDYTDYGYVYAISNKIAEELGWETDLEHDIEKASLDVFFSSNPTAIDLLYPVFSTNFASEETVSYCKALSRMLFSKIKVNSALKQDIETQLDTYCALIADFAEKNSIPYERQECGYAYYGENVLLRFMTTYAEFFIDINRTDADKLYEDVFSDYISLYNTVCVLNEEITNAVEYFGVSEHVGVIKIKWLNSETDAAQKLLTDRNGIYYGSTHIAYLASLFPYLHEYYHHIEYTIKQVNERTWQSQAFCELGSSYSQYSLLMWETAFTQYKENADVFRLFAGHEYSNGREDFYEAMDILCYINGYELDYLSGGAAINSFTRYLVDRWGEKTVYTLLLYPDRLSEIVNSDWDELAAEWEQHIKDKYADIDVSGLLG